MTVHNEIIRTSTREYKGYEVKSDGDSFMLVFGSAKDACAFAVKVEEALLEV
jgi:class 3 adenylate cyclase